MGGNEFFFDFLSYTQSRLNFPSISLAPKIAVVFLDYDRVCLVIFFSSCCFLVTAISSRFIFAVSSSGFSARLPYYCPQR